MTGDGAIRGEHPFRTPEPARDPARRLRGRLAAPVTIVTAGTGEGRTGLTVSSIVVAEGDPPLVYTLVGSATDLWVAIAETGRFVVHVATARDRVTADVFAGLRPSPGGLFAGRDVEETEYGPVLADLGNRAYCTMREGREESYSVLVSGAIDRVEIDELTDPLAYFRGAYRVLG